VSIYLRHCNESLLLEGDNPSVSINDNSEIESSERSREVKPREVKPRTYEPKKIQRQYLDPKNEEALNDAYSLFQQTGYNGSLNDFITLISTNNEALNDAHKLFVETGYNGSVEDFSSLVLGKPEGVQTAAATQPNNGYSPYDDYFGSGVYHNWTQHSLTIKTSDENAVCLLKDVSSGKVIRNEFIRKNSIFKLTGIPHGTYKLQYYTGFDWDHDYLVPNTSIKGGFKSDASFSESSNPSDLLRFEYSEQYSNHYTVTLYKVANGNMETKEINSNLFF
jgi:hypothetical protein